jgi:hypothetical protein
MVQLWVKSLMQFAMVKPCKYCILRWLLLGPMAYGLPDGLYDGEVSSEQMPQKAI